MAQKRQYLITRIHSEGNNGSGMVMRTEDRDQWIREIRRTIYERGIKFENVIVIKHEDYDVCCMAETAQGFAAMAYIRQFAPTVAKLPKEVTR